MSDEQLHHDCFTHGKQVLDAMLTVLGGCEPQLDVHINASLNVGPTPIHII